MTNQEFEHVDVRLIKDGPMLVRGAATIQGTDGRVFAVDRPVVALCQCHKSSRLPWCDSTHKMLRRSAR